MSGEGLGVSGENSGAQLDPSPLATRHSPPSLLARKALLALKIIDPACGSGHFLLAAARRIAAEVARLDAESDIPEAIAYRHALREVVAHCIYGVDLNPLAVELCQTALWLETLEPGKPLGFLDHHIRHGNSLVGILDPAIMDEGIPDKAYIALSGDDKPTCAALKKSNKKQAGGRQADLFGAASVDTLARTLADLDALPEDSVEAIAAKRAAFRQAEADAGLARQRLKADLFCAAFFAPKTPATAERIPLSRDLVLAATGQPLRPGVAELTREMAGEYHFFHWRLAFPEVFLGREVSGEGRVGDRASSEGREASSKNLDAPLSDTSPLTPRPLQVLMWCWPIRRGRSPNYRKKSFLHPGPTRLLGWRGPPGRRP